MRIPILIAFISVIYASSYGQATIVDDATKLIEQNKCDAAIIKLEGASAELQNTAYFLKTMARAHDCKNHTAEAITYYRRYLEKGSDDSVKTRYDALVAKKESDVKSNTINEQYKQISGQKGKKRGDGKGYYIGLALEGLIPTSFGPFKWGMKYGADFGIPLKAKKITLVTNISLTGYSYTRERWMDEMLGNISYSTSLSSSFGGDATIALQYWLTKDDDFSLAVAPVIGYKYANIITPDIHTFEKIKFPSLFGLDYGAEVKLQFGNKYVCLGYNFFKVSKTPLTSGAPNYTAKINAITIKLSGNHWRW